MVIYSTPLFFMLSKKSYCFPSQIWQHLKYGTACQDK